MDTPSVKYTYKYLNNAPNYNLYLKINNTTYQHAKVIRIPLVNSFLDGFKLHC